MVTSRLLKPVACLIVAGTLALTLGAAAIVQRNSEEASDYFQALILIEQIDEYLLKSVTSVIDFMNRPADERPGYAASECRSSGSWRCPAGSG